MQWIHQFQLFLFDFDGLLVNTEHLHYQAYIEMCLKRGFELTWDFEKYCSLAHVDPTAIRKQIFTEFPALSAISWDVLYEEKKRAYMEILKGDNLQLLPGAADLLTALAKANIRRCVATHSPLEQITYIRSVLPELNSIPHWITREDYQNPKPAPDAYLTAIAKYSQPGDIIIGFEDSPRGLAALQATPARAILISTTATVSGATHFSSFEQIPTTFF